VVHDNKAYRWSLETSSERGEGDDSRENQRTY